MRLAQQAGTLNPVAAMDSLTEHQFRLWAAYYMINAGHYQDEAEATVDPAAAMAAAQSRYPNSSAV